MLHENINKRKESLSKVTPEALQLIYLDEIAGLLNDQLERMEESEGSGLIDTVSVTVTSPIFELSVPDWYSFTIFNDGPNPVFVDVNVDYNVRSFDTPLNATEDLVVDFEKPKIKRVFLGVQAGNVAAVRIFGSK